jgi:hypothetical protein
MGEVTVHHISTLRTSGSSFRGLFTCAGGLSAVLRGIAFT